MGEQTRLYWISAPDGGGSVLTGENRGVRFLVCGFEDQSSPDVSWLQSVHERIDVVFFLSNRRDYIEAVRSTVRPLYSVVHDPAVCSGSWCDSLAILSSRDTMAHPGFVRTRSRGVHLVQRGL